MQKFNRMGLLAACGLAAVTVSLTTNTRRRAKRSYLLISISVMLAMVVPKVSLSYTKTMDGTIADIALSSNNEVIYDGFTSSQASALRFTKDGDKTTVKLRGVANEMIDGIYSYGVTVNITDPWARVLGFGPIRLLGDYAGLYGNVNDVDVTNRVVFCSNSYAAGENSTVLTLHNIGVDELNTSKRVLLGRDGTRSSTVCLNLDDPANDAVAYFMLKGDIDLKLKGGTIKLAEDSDGRIFRAANSDATPEITVANSPLAIDVPKNRNATFGIMPTFSNADVVWDVAEEYKTADWSFESGAGSWTFTGSGSGVYNRGEKDFDGKGSLPTTNGTKYVMVRQSGSMSRTISLSTAGYWRAVFEQGCRPGNYSLSMEVTVTIDGNVVATLPTVSSAMRVHGFQEVKIPPVWLVQGDHTFVISLQSASDQYRSMNFDAVRFERCVETHPAPKLTKTGAGTFMCSDMSTEGVELDVQSGKVVLKGSKLSSSTITVRQGSQLDVCGLDASSSTIDVKKGAVITFGAHHAEDELIVNGSFEEPTIPNYAFKWASECKWNLNPTDSKGNRPGIQHNGSDYSKIDGSFKTPYGDQTLFLRANETAEQTISVAKAGNYVLSYSRSSRCNYNSWTMGLRVFVDNVEVYFDAGRSVASDFATVSTVLDLASGPHTIKLKGESGVNTNAGYSMLFIDNVSIVPMSVDALGKAHLALRSGSIVRLDNPEKAVIGAVTVDGVEVRGGANALRAAGVVVEGDGRVQCGDPLGLTVIIK